MAAKGRLWNHILEQSISNLNDVYESLILIPHVQDGQKTYICNQLPVDTDIAASSMCVILEIKTGDCCESQV
jgi:hypothetical protein